MRMFSFPRLASFALVAGAVFCLSGSPSFAQAAEEPAADKGLDAYGIAAPESGPSQQEAMSNQAFGSVLNNMMPLRPDQIDQLAERMSSVEEAASRAMVKQLRPKPVNKVETVTLDPSSPPPVIKLMAGNISTVIVLDATGAPWPISDVGYTGKLDVKVHESAPNIVRIVPLNRFDQGNITLQLYKQNIPLIFRVEVGRDEVYYRYDVRVPALGPNANPPQFKSANSLMGGNAILTAVLNGYPPAGSKRLEVIGLDDRSAAWDIGGQTYLRTPHKLLSPAWSSSTESGDGTTVYVIPETPVLLLSDQGMMVRARLARPEGLVAGDSSNEH